MLIAWTTVSSRADADILATEAIANNLAACVQVDGPIVSYYRWQGKMEKTEEFRLMFKFLPYQLESLQQRILAKHPYETPEWIVVKSERTGEKYLSWARANSSTRPL